MKKCISSIIVFLVYTQIAVSQTREVKVLDVNWKFQKGNFEEAYKVNFNDSKWQSVTIPHDWAIYGPFDKKVDIQHVAIEQNGEKIATEKPDELVLCPILELPGIAIHLHYQKNLKGKK